MKLLVILRNNFLRMKPQVVLVMLAGLSIVVYLIISQLTFRVGFPLDDAWIHETYARNLVNFREWAFITGQKSAGSTSPLWSILIAIGYLMSVKPIVWAMSLGWILLSSIALAGINGYKFLLSKDTSAQPPIKSNKISKTSLLVGLVLVLEWHLVWAACSGMETLLFAFLALVVLINLLRATPNWIAIGLLVGLSVWVRPDGLTLLGPGLFVLILGNGSSKYRLASTRKLLFSFALFIIPYFIFHYYLSGDWLPNTFFAKQAEYSILIQQPLWKRIVEQMKLPLVGVGILLLPGFIVMIRDGVRQREWGLIAGICWFAGYLLIYALRLPVTYQHGRYVMPVMPVYFLWSLAGVARILPNFSQKTLTRVIQRAWVISIGAILLVFWAVGARTYAKDVAVIESEMVDVAKWVNTNLEPGILVAAHDIGALGYFCNCRLLDLAGLISPEVIPFISDQEQLAIFLDSKRADYLVTFVGLYPLLEAKSNLIYLTNAPYAPSLGMENMAVYRWSTPEK